MQERRRFIRMRTPVRIDYPNPQTLKTERSVTRDVSESGLRVPTGVRLEAGQQLPLTVHVPFDGTTLQATGEVRWVRQISRSGAVPHYEVGMGFHWIEALDRQRLSRHLASLSSG
jgi:hypothetical protein